MEPTTRYRATDGTIVTRDQIVQEFKKARIVAGHSTSGDDYKAALKEWLSTYHRMSESDMKRQAAPFKVFFICLAITTVVALLFGFTGGPLAFIITFALGFIGSLGVVFWVTIFTTPAPK